MNSYEEQNFYELLEISPAATLEEIQQAYRRAKSTYSPDSPALYTMFSKEEALELSKLIDEAYLILSNHAKRRQYDLQLHQSQFSVFQEQKDSVEDKPSAYVPPSKVQGITATQREELKYKGLGITKFGQFQLNESFEEEIRQQEVFDGSYLLKIRLYKNIQIEPLSEYTKIGKHHINCIEKNDFANLPAFVFVRGFVKQLAENLEIDTTKVVDSYMKLFKNARS